MNITEEEYRHAVSIIEKYVEQKRSEIKKAEMVLKTSKGGFELMENADFTYRTMMALRNNGLNYMSTLNDVVKISKKDLLDTRNVGKKTISEIQEVLKSYGLKLK